MTKAGRTKTGMTKAGRAKTGLTAGQEGVKMFEYFNS